MMFEATLEPRRKVKPRMIGRKWERVKLKGQARPGRLGALPWGCGCTPYRLGQIEFDPQPSWIIFAQVYFKLSPDDTDFLSQSSLRLYSQHAFGSVGPQTTSPCARPPCKEPPPSGSARIEGGLFFHFLCCFGVVPNLKLNTSRCNNNLSSERAATGARFQLPTSDRMKT